MGMKSIKRERVNKCVFSDANPTTGSGEYVLGTEDENHKFKKSNSSTNVLKHT